MPSSDAKGKLAPDHREWLSSEPDFLVLAHLARYHARKQLAAEALALFDGTGDPVLLARARRELETALAIWTDLVRLTDGLYPERMAFAPDDNGHWKDKLPYVQHDLRLIEEREEVLRRFGRFERGFDFGGPVPEPAPYGTYWHDPFILRNTVAPRFQAVDPGSLYDPARGYGWLGGGQREALAIEPTPYLEVRAAVPAPKNLPHDVLFRDAIRGVGAQTFAVDVPPGDYTVTFLHPDRTLEVRQLRAENGRLAIVFPEDSWTVSGLVIQSLTPPAPTAVRDEPPLLPRPAMRHEAPTTLAGWPAAPGGACAGRHARGADGAPALSAGEPAGVVQDAGERPRQGQLHHPRRRHHASRRPDVLLRGPARRMAAAGSSPIPWRGRPTTSSRSTERAKGGSGRGRRLLTTQATAETANEPSHSRS